MFLLYFLTCALLGCQSGPAPAPYSNFIFTGDQATETMNLLESLADEAPREPQVALDLLPPDGIRWPTIKDAVAHAVAVPQLEMAIARSMIISENEQVFYMINTFFWPAKITVKRIDEQPGVSVEAIMGPDPDLKRSRLAARDIERRVHASIRKYGSIRRIKPYEIRMTTREVVTPMTQTSESDE